MLETLLIPYCILSQDEQQASIQMDQAINEMNRTGIPYAIVVKKGTFGKYAIQATIASDYELSRERAVQLIVEQLKGDEVIVSTTGKTSRELFECRAAMGHPHHSDFLTVGSMGHASQIALGIALSKPGKKVICVDGDGAVLMHMGGLAIIGSMAPDNYIHIVINNAAHESVGGQPTVGAEIDLVSIAKANGYASANSVSSANALSETLAAVSKQMCPALIEVKVRIGSRGDLGRPTIKPIDNKKDFMNNLEA